LTSPFWLQEDGSKNEGWEIRRAFQIRSESIMKKLIPVVGISILAVVVARAQDPAKVDPQHYKVLLDNEYVRILDVHLPE
jgi:hypothetical protein